jgi:hypothetical protein
MASPEQVVFYFMQVLNPDGNLIQRHLPPAAARDAALAQ